MPLTVVFTVQHTMKMPLVFFTISRVLRLRLRLPDIGGTSDMEQKVDRRDLIGGNPEIFTNAFTSNLQWSCFGFPTLDIYALDVRGPVCNLQAGDPL